ncbi:MAG: DM13 domain-containing protein [Pseudomonadota bacterium]
MTPNRREPADRDGQDIAIALAPVARRGVLRMIALGSAGALAACAMPGGGEVGGAGGASADGAAAVAPTPAEPGPDARVTARGSFVGKSNHVTTGHARVVFDQGRVLIELEEDFTFDGAPDPKVGLGNDGFDAESIIAPLRSNSGRQLYALPAGLDIGRYREVWIWCERFSVPLGVAELALT